jgi:hypothetical protein
MKTLLRSEEVFLFLFGCYLFSLLPYSWWWFVLLLLTPDIGVLGYLLSNRLGAYAYNFTHHRGLGIGLYLLGIYLYAPLLQLAGVIVFAHAALDRALGYGLKYESGFKHTHLDDLGERHG